MTGRTEPWPAKTRVIVVDTTGVNNGIRFLGRTATVTAALLPGDAVVVGTRTFLVHLPGNLIELDGDRACGVLQPHQLRPLEDPDDDTTARREDLVDERERGVPA